MAKEHTTLTGARTDEETGRVAIERPRRSEGNMVAKELGVM
jgi:hypothetical protein